MSLRERLQTGCLFVVAEDGRDEVGRERLRTYYLTCGGGEGTGPALAVPMLGRRMRIAVWFPRSRTELSTGKYAVFLYTTR